MPRRAACSPMPPGRHSICPGIETRRRPSDGQAGRGRQPSRHALARAAGERKDRQSRAQHQRRAGPRAGRVHGADRRRCRRGAWSSSTASTSSRRRAPTRCSRCSRSRRPNTLFFLVSHAPGRLLPTIRSRCRRLDFQTLDDDAMTSILEAQAPDLSAAERQRIIAMSFGSAGTGARLRRARPRQARGRGARDPAPGRSDQRPPFGAGDPSLARKASAERYAAFLDLAPSLIAREARELDGAPRERALDAYAKARELAAIAPRAVARPGGDRVPDRRDPRRGRARPLP